MMRASLSQKAGFLFLALCTGNILSVAPAIAAKTQSPSTPAAPLQHERYRALLSAEKLVRGGQISPHWLEDGRSFWFADGEGDRLQLWLVDGASGTKKNILDSEAVRRSLRAQGLRSGAIVPISVSPSGAVRFMVGDRLFERAAGDKEIRVLKAEAAPKDPLQPAIVRPSFPSLYPPLVELPNPSGTAMLTLREHDLWVRGSEAADDIRLTRNGTGRNGWTTQNAHWSPDGTLVAVQRVDDTGVNSVPVIDWLKSPAEISSEPYPISSGPYPKAALFLADAQGRSLKEIDPARPDSLLHVMGFSADGRLLRFARLDRWSRRVDLYEADVKTGSVRRIFTESARTFLYWPFGFVFLGPPAHFLSDGNFLWLSEKDGYNQLYLHDARGKPIRQLTKSPYPIVDVVRVDEAAGTIFARAQPDRRRPYDVHLMAIPMTGGKPERLTEAEGIHRIAFSPSGTHFLDTYSAPATPPRTELRNASGRFVGPIAEADISGLTALGWKAPEEFVVKAADGKTDIYGLIIKPFDFDPGKRYPVIESIYGGPQSQMVPHDFLAASGDADYNFALAMAQHGYIFVLTDGRGTPGRGKTFHDVVYGRLGEFEIEDHAGAIRQLAESRPYMDLSSVGIMGLSYGGYYTIRALIRAPDLYKVGVATSPVELGTGAHTLGLDLYLGPLEQNRAAYEKTRNVPHIAKIKGDLLIIAGTADINTPFAHMMAYSQAFVDAGKPFDMMVLPNRNHPLASAVPDKDGMRPAIWYEATRRYFLQHLPSDPAAPSSGAPKTRPNRNDERQEIR